MMIFWKQIAKKKSFHPKLKIILPMQLSTWLSHITFNLQAIWLQRLVVINWNSCKRSSRICILMSYLFQNHKKNCEEFAFLSESSSVNSKTEPSSKWALGSSQRYMICVTLFAPGTSQKTHHCTPRCKTGFQGFGPTTQTTLTIRLAQWLNSG